MITTFYDCYQVLTKVYSQGAFITSALNSTQVEPLKRREITKICYGVVDKDIGLSYYISKLTTKPPKQAIRTLLKIAMYCIAYLKKPKHAVVSSCVELVKKLGKTANAGFVNAVLRKFDVENIDLPSEKTEFLSVKYNYPVSAIKLLLNTYGEELTKQIISYDKNHNFARFENGVVGEKYLLDNGFEYKKTPFDGLFDVKGLAINDDFNDGKFTFQSIGSVAICDVVSSGESLLDACSAPGGKSVLLSDRFDSVVSCDIHEHRVELIKSYAKRMKKPNITAIIKDSSKYCDEFKETFTHILCDVPCSGFGTLKDNPDIKLKKCEIELENLNKVQLDILSNCSKYLKNGGELVYSTCSIFKEENDEIVDKFLKNNSDFTVERVSSPLDSIKTEYGLQFLPNISFGAGFYLCKLRKTK